MAVRRQRIVYTAVLLNQWFLGKGSGRGIRILQCFHHLKTDKVRRMLARNAQLLRKQWVKRNIALFDLTDFLVKSNCFRINGEKNSRRQPGQLLLWIKFQQYQSHNLRWGEKPTKHTQNQTQTNKNQPNEKTPKKQWSHKILVMLLFWINIHDNSSSEVLNHISLWHALE